MSAVPQLTFPMAIQPRLLNATQRALGAQLREVDPKLWHLLELEKERQKKSITLIASENFIPRYCSDALASCLSSKYSEGYPGKRYYAGNEVIDQVETLCQARALQLFGLSKDEWAVNVQALSGSPANFAVFTALLNPGDRIMGMSLFHGGHLSHGFHGSQSQGSTSAASGKREGAPVSGKECRKKGRAVTATARYFECESYMVDEKTELIDYEALAEDVLRFKPKLLVAGFSAYSRPLDYKKFREIANSVGAILMADMAHVSGLVAAHLAPSPFEHCDVVTTTTHKTLRGPRGALIFSKKSDKLSEQIDKAVFPGCQGGPHNHSIAAVAAALEQAKNPEFVVYQRNVLANAKALAKRLEERKFRMATGGTENHSILVDLSSKKCSGARAEMMLEQVNIIVNKNATVRDLSARRPSGIRLGTPAMTFRGFSAKDFEQVGDWISEVVDLAADFDFKKQKPSEKAERIFKTIREAAEELASSYPT